MKATRSNRKITPFGGVIPVLKQIRDFKIADLIQESLGSRAKQAKYGYDDIIIAWILTNLCGGMRLDHITKLRKNLDIIPGLNLPSHDTLGRVMKSLSTENFVSESVHRLKIRNPKLRELRARSTYDKITVKETNEHEPLNKLLVKATVKMGLLRQDKKYTLDMDATLIETKCISAKRSYKKVTGFLPMVSTIGKLPVYVGMRNGNVAPGAEIKECLERTFNLLEQNNISVDKVRMDGAGYAIGPFTFLNDKNVKFYVGGVNSPVVMNKLKGDIVWSPFFLETTNFFWDCECSEVRHALHGNEFEYRLIILRSKLGSKKTPKTWIKGEEYAYKILITNDFESSPEEIFKFYNQRGASEKNFDVLKNDFGWKFPPFCNMNENSVFLLIAALTNNVYQAMINFLGKEIKEIRLNARLREFIYVFMSVACELTDTEYVFFDTDILYEKIC